MFQTRQQRTYQQQRTNTLGAWHAVAGTISSPDFFSSLFVLCSWFVIVIAKKLDLAGRRVERSTTPLVSSHLRCLFPRQKQTPHLSHLSLVTGSPRLFFSITPIHCLFLPSYAAIDQHISVLLSIQSFTRCNILSRSFGHPASFENNNNNNTSNAFLESRFIGLQDRRPRHLDGIT